MGCMGDSHEKRLDFDTEIEAVKSEGDDLIVEGMLATYDLDKQHERWVPGSFDDAIKSFMANPSRPVLYEHKREYGQFGTVEALEQREHGLWGRLRLPRPTGTGVLSQAWQAVKAGVTRGVSVRAPMMMLRQSDGTALLRPKAIKEFSITPFPVNESSVVAVAQKAFGEDAAEEDLDELITHLDGQLDTLRASLAELNTDD